MAMGGGAEGLGIKGHKLIVGVEGGVSLRGRGGELRFARSVARGEHSDLLSESGGLFGEVGAVGKPRVNGAECRGESKRLRWDRQRGGGRVVPFSGGVPC
jgi:hypothetical protein